MSQSLANVIEQEVNSFFSLEGDTHLWFHISERMGVWSDHGADARLLLDFLFGSVAVLYQQDIVNYAKGDQLANTLFQAAQDRFYPEIFSDNRVDESDLWWRTYLAFDAGEFSRGDGLDAVATYTQPLIDLIVAEIAARGGLSEMLSTATGRTISEPAATS